jgi:CRISPR-associated protein Cas2
MSFYIICYDTPSNKRRRKFSKFLVNYLIRVQESVFEGYLRRAKFRKLLHSLERVVDEDADSLRVYIMTESVHKKSIIFGKPGLVEKTGYYLVE